MDEGLSNLSRCFFCKFKNKLKKFINGARRKHGRGAQQSLAVFFFSLKK